MCIQAPVTVTKDEVYNDTDVVMEGIYALSLLGFSFILYQHTLCSIEDGQDLPYGQGVGVGGVLEYLLTPSQAEEAAGAIYFKVRS